MTTHMPLLRALEASIGNGDHSFISMEQHAEILKDAVFAVEDDEAYFVMKDDSGYHAIIGAFRGDGGIEFKATGFQVNFLVTYKYRDAAILCVLNICTNDSGHNDGIREITREKARWVQEF
jgi:hypothetical protein